jgi:nucleoside-diphosphate-sugar epimerase
VITIGVIGANGQVGTEVCLFLNCWEDVKVIAICRTRLGSAVLRSMGITCRHGSMQDAAHARELLADCDLVADFSLPRGSADDIKAAYRANITNALESASGATRYVFISSLMALGMKGVGARIRYHWIPKTVYAATKRFGERLARRLGKEKGVGVFVLRLGEVHGVLQNCSKGTRAFLTHEPPTVVVPDHESYSVFCFTIAEALVNIAQGKEQPGVYELVSTPAWTYQELFEYIAQQPVAVEVALPPAISRVWYSRLKRFAIGCLRDNRELAQAYLFGLVPGYEQKVKLNHWVRQIRSKESLFVNASKYTVPVMRGIPPGKRLSSISDSRVTMHEKVGVCERIISELDKATPLP